MFDKTTTVEQASANAAYISREMIDKYLARLAKNHSGSTVAIYHSVLSRFYKFLPEDGRIDADTLSAWEVCLKSGTGTIKTVKFNLRIVRAFLRDAGVPEDLIAPSKPKPIPEMMSDAPDLSRAEYIFLLQQARAMGKEKAYLIIKTMCQTGIKGTELAQLTLDVLRAGGGWIETLQDTRYVRVPPLLREELLRYAERERIAEGAVFVTKDGQPLHRVLVWKQLRQILQQTGLPEEKGQPGNLNRLYWETQKSFYPLVAGELDAAYDALLAREEEQVRWAM